MNKQENLPVELRTDKGLRINSKFFTECVGKL